jgi:hypothetical protein
VQVERHRAEADAVVDQQVRDILLIVDGDAELGDLVRQRVEHRPSGIIPCITCAPVLVCAEKPLIQLAIGRAGEGASPFGKLKHRGWRLARQELDGVWIAEEVALLQRIGEVLLPAILWIEGAESGVDAARGKHRMRVLAGPLADEHDVASGSVGRDSGAQAAAAGADHKHIRDIGALMVSMRIHSSEPFCISSAAPQGAKAHRLSGRKT